MAGFGVLMRQVPGKVIHGGCLKREEAQKGRSFLDFSASINPYPPEIVLKPDLVAIRSYPDDDYTLLKTAISKPSGRVPQEITVGNGSIEVLRTYCQAVLGKGLTYGTIEPTFGEYAYSARLTGATPSKNPEKADALFVCNPNNPDAKLRPREDILSLVRERAAEGKATMVDEAFIELSDRDESIVRTRETGVFIMRSLTKSFAVPGLRFGYGFGDEELVQQMEALRPPWTVNCLAEQFAIEAMSRLGELASSREKIARERLYLEQHLEDAGFRCQPSKVNFILATGARPASEVADILRQKGILVRDCTSFGLPTSVRIAVRQHPENERFIEVLKECLP
jgi:threonine-phosphate decarboxylase